MIKKLPPKLYVKGNISLLNQKCVAIVGTRNSTPYGKEIAYKIANEISANEITVVSGLALRNRYASTFRSVKRMRKDNSSFGQRNKQCVSNRKYRTF